MTDEQILINVNNGTDSEKGFRMLMDKYQEPVYQHIRRMVHNHEDTNDILQNTFIKVFKNIKKFEGRSSLYTWIYRIATNEAITHLNKIKRMKLVYQNDEDDTINRLKSDDGQEPASINNMLEDAIRSLPDKQKSVFSLRYFDEMSYKQMSIVLNTSEGALKASYHHAVKKIEVYFKNINIY